MYGAVMSVRLNQDFLRQILHKTRPAGIEVFLADKWMKGKRNGRTDGRTDGWVNGDLQADRETDIMKLTFIFLYTANWSRVEKNSATEYSP